MKNLKNVVKGFLYGWEVILLYYRVWFCRRNYQLNITFTNIDIGTGRTTSKIIHYDVNSWKAMDLLFSNFGEDYIWDIDDTNL